MEHTQFTWLKALPAIQGAITRDVNEGLGALARTARAQPLQGFELELLGRLLRDVDAGALTAMPVRRVAVLASHTSEPIANAARIAALREGYLAVVYEAPFASYRQEILAADSGLYAFQPDIVVIAAAPADDDAALRGALADDEVETVLAAEVDSWRGLWSVLAKRLGIPVLQHVVEEPVEEFTGVAERRAAWTPARFTRALNDRLIETAPSFVKWVDVDRLAARVGRQNWRDPRLYHHGKFGFSSRYLPEYTTLLGAAMRIGFGGAKKALILDLDNTLWGGVIGDDRLDGIRLGPDTAEGSAYEAFCRYVKALGQRGVILGICSKNEHSIAAEVFEQHEHMPLALDDFAVVSCNWKDKATNLAQIARELNIDTSALVFVDDNPAECELIRQSLPEVQTVLLDGDPALFVRKLDQQRLFETQSFSRDDLGRAESYRARAKSIALQSEAPDLDSYLASLDMKATLRVADATDLARLAQMEMKTNQFNLATRRLTLEQLQAMTMSPDTVVLAVSLADRFADHGLVSYVAATVEDDRLVVTDWLMSCRVFSRGLEHFVFNSLVDHAMDKGVAAIEARFTPTAKNNVMAGLFTALGFTVVPGGAPPEGPWRYEIAGEKTPVKHFIADASAIPPAEPLLSSQR